MFCEVFYPIQTCFSPYSCLICFVEVNSRANLWRRPFERHQRSYVWWTLLPSGATFMLLTNLTRTEICIPYRPSPCLVRGSVLLRHVPSRKAVAKKVCFHMKICIFHDLGLFPFLSMLPGLYMLDILCRRPLYRPMWKPLTRRRRTHVWWESSHP